MKGHRVSLSLNSLPISPNGNNNHQQQQQQQQQQQPRDYYTESNIHQDILIIYTLPGGEVHQEKVNSAENVSELKRRLHANKGIPFTSTSLFFKGKCMLDPLSLNDIAGVVDTSGVAHIEVKVFFFFYSFQKDIYLSQFIYLVIHFPLFVCILNTIILS